MQRRFAKATRNAGLEATVSARALMARAPSRADFAQLGMSPHRGRSTVRPSSRWSTTVSGSVGATFQDGWNAPAVIVAGRRAPRHRRSGRPPPVASAGSSGRTCAHGGTSRHRRQRAHRAVASRRHGAHPPCRPLVVQAFGAHSTRASRARSSPPAVRRHRRGAAAAGHGRHRARQLCRGRHPAVGGGARRRSWPSTAGRVAGSCIVRVLVLLAAVGMWRLRRWGWALMISLVGLSLVLDITMWFEQRRPGRAPRAVPAHGPRRGQRLLPQLRRRSRRRSA